MSTDYQVSSNSKYPSQQVLVALFGCNKYQLGDKMRNSMHIPDEYLGALKKYRMKHEKGSFFSSMIEDGTISFDSGNNGEYVRYSIIYHNCSPYAAKKAKEIRLSFRAAHDEFNLEPIVLIEIVDAGTGE